MAGRQEAMLKQKNTPRGQGGRCSGSPSPPSGLQARIAGAFGAPPRQASYPIPQPPSGHTHAWLAATNGHRPVIDLQADGPVLCLQASVAA